MKRQRVAFTWYLNWRYPLEAIRDLWRQTIWFVQRGLYGWADCDWWGLDDYLSTWLPYALRQYKKSGMSYPGWGSANTAKKWYAILEKMARGFEAVQELSDLEFGNQKEYSEKRDKLKKETEEGMKLFTKWFRNLWD